MIQDVLTHPLGEIAMGAEAYGVTIKTNYGDFDLFAETPVLVGSDDARSRLEISKCGNYAKLEGAFSTWVLDIRNHSVSVLKATIRTENDEWCEEQAIFGSSRAHLNGFKRHCLPALTSG